MNLTDLKEKAKKIYTTVVCPEGDVFEMSVFEYSRWLALMKSIGIIEDGAKRYKHDLESNDDWIQPIAIEKFIKESADDILTDLMQDEDFMLETKMDETVECNLVNTLAVC